MNKTKQKKQVQQALQALKALHKNFKNWCGKENKFFTTKLGCGEDTFTNGEVLAAHIGLAVAIPVMTLLTSFIENLNI